MKNKHFFKKLQTVILAAVIAFTSIPVNVSATEVTEISVEDAVNLPEDSDFADNDLEVSANDLSSDTNADLDSDLVTEDSFFGFKLNPVSKDELNREIEELKETASVPVIDLSERNENDLDADCYSGTSNLGQDISNMTFAAKYDPRSLGLVTSIKNQGQWGLCWNYAALSTVESCFIKIGLTDSTIDLSELYAAYACYKRGHADNDISFTTFCNKGSQPALVYNTMNDGFGPVLESTVPWKEPTDNFTLSDEVLNSHLYEIQKYYITNIDNSKENISKIKYLISNYGATTISLYMYYTNGWGFKEAGSVNGDASFYFPQEINSVNHALSVVGWDDNYPATGFGVTAPGNGAWLVKNSYGSGDTRLGSGYMWVSYYDGSMKDDYCTTPVFVKNGSLATNITAVADKTEVYTGDKVTITATKTPADSIGDIKSYYNEAKLVSKNNGVYTFEYTAPTNYSGWDGTEYEKSLQTTLRFMMEDNTTYGSEYKDIDIPITVLSKPIVTLPENTKSLKIGENYQLSPTVKGNIPDGFTESFSYVSSDPKVAYVNNKGKIIVKGYGSADITVTDENGLAKEAIFTVNGLYNYTDISTTVKPQISLTLNKGESKSYAVPIFLESDGDVLEITGNKDAKIEKISGNDFGYVEDGKIVIDTSKDEYVNPNGDYTTNGSYEFKVSYKGVYTNNQMVSTSVKVNLKTIYPVITTSVTEVNLKKGESYQIKPVITQGTLMTPSYKYESDNSLVYVSEDGLITVNDVPNLPAYVTVTDEKGYAKPAVIKVTGYYDYKSLASSVGDSLNLTITNTYDSFCQSISPVFLEDENLYIDPSDYTITIDSSGSTPYVFGNTLYYSAYTGMKKTQSFNLTLTYKGIYTNGKAVSKKIPVTITAEDWVVSAMNYTPTPVPSNNPVIPNPSNGNGNGNVTNPNPNNTQTPSVKPVTVKKTSCSAKNRKGKLKITWKKKSGINGYQVQYSTNKKFKKAKTKTIRSVSTKTKTYKAIKKGKRHFVRVRTYKIVNGRKYYSSWSKVKSVVVK